jgi:alpha-amylase/alpha-mannosidase (GH57 family)
VTAARGRIDLVVAWHMHQPDYRDRASGQFAMPWVYLHAIKDYTDMAWHLEQHPQMRAVVNFVPVLLDQLEDYVDQFDHGLRDPLLALLARDEATPLGPAERAYALRTCFQANHSRLIEPYPAYRRMRDLYASLAGHGERELAYLSDRYVFDLVTWYHLAWTGESVRRESELIARLLSQETSFTFEDRRSLLQLFAELIRDVVPRYRRLAERGQIELSTTPHGHPLAPLMFDFASARDSLPDAPLPHAHAYPGGAVRVSRHLESALQTHAHRFGAAARGVWPAEGAVSPALLSVLGAAGVGWTASSEAVLANSLRRSHVGEAREAFLYRPYRIKGVGAQPVCFFRDDRLSDLIGFEYSKWNGRDAAEHFINQALGSAGKAKGKAAPVVSVILDGENAWEFFPYNGFYFLSALYERLQNHPQLRPTTFSAVLDERRSAAPADHAFGELATLVAGSWVFGNFATWIGSEDKNRAWDLLCAAKSAFDAAIAGGGLSAEQANAATAQLVDCESSDWFWWPGDYNPGPAVAAFEAMFRAKLAHLYHLLQLPAPAELAVSFSHGAGRPEMGGAMRRST